MQSNWLSKETRKQIVTLYYNPGNSSRKIATILNISDSTVRRIAREEIPDITRKRLVRQKMQDRKCEIIG